MKLHIKATPGAKHSQVLGWHTDPTVGRVLKIAIKAPPVEGKANKALIAFLAKTLAVSKSQVTLTKGKTARIKTFEVPDNLPLPR